MVMKNLNLQDRMKEKMKLDPPSRGMVPKTQIFYLIGIYATTTILNTFLQREEGKGLPSPSDPFIGKKQN